MASSHGSGLVSIRAEVAAFVAAAQVIANQAAASAATALTAEAALHLASEAARREVASFVEDFYEKKIFDPFLRFASAEDEAAYREREEKYQRDIQAARALGTPEGDLRALELVEAQMLDAKAHGAGDSGQFAPMAAGIASKKAALKAALGGEAELGAPSPPADEATRTAPTPDKSADPLAALREAGVVLADPNEDGHGVLRSAASPPAKGRA